VRKLLFVEYSVRGEGIDDDWKWVKVCSDIFPLLDMVPTHKDSWLSVCSWYALKEIMTEQKAEKEHILYVMLKV
jgi:hypothetical protein